MQHSRQVLLSKTSLVRIQHAEQTGTEKEQELVKLRFKDLEYNEVTFKSIKGNPKNPTRFTGVIELTHRDGFEFTQTWTAADTVSFFKTAQHVELATVESFKDIIKPGLYFVKDVAEMVVLLRDEMGLEEVLSLLGYGFESGEVELIERHVQLKSPMTIGTLPVRRIFKKEDGTYSDGTRLEVTLSETNGDVVAGNPDLQPTLTVKYLPKKKPTVLKEGGVVLKEGSKLVTITFMGVDKPIIAGELVDGSFSTPLDLTDLVGLDISFLVTVGLADDARTQEYSVQYVAENWSFQPVDEPKYTRVGYPLELSGLLSSDLGNEPWGDFKTTITQPDGSTEIQELDTTGVVNVTTTPLTDGELNIDFKCGEGDNTVNVNYQIQPPVELGELEFSEVVVTSNVLNPEQLLELSSELKAFDGTTRTDAEVKVLFDSQEQKTIHPDIEGNLITTLPVANDDLDDKVIDVTLKHLELETVPIKVTIKPSAQVPHRFEVLNDSGDLGSPSEFKFLIYDTKDRMIIGAEGTYSIEGEDTNEYPFTSVDEYYVIDMGPGPEGVTETHTVSVNLKCQGLTDNTHKFSWEPSTSVNDFVVLSGGFNHPTYTPGLTTDLSFDYVLDNPDSIPADKVTLTATAIDNNGDVRTVFESVIDNQIDGHIENIEGFEEGFTGKDLNVEVVYLIEFKGVTKEITKVYPLTVESTDPVLTTVELDPDIPTEAIVQTGILLKGTTLDQYGEPFYEEGLKLYVSGASFNPDEVVVNPDGTFEIMVSHRHNIFSATFSVRSTSSTDALAHHSVNFVKGDKYMSAVFDPWNQQKFSPEETATTTGVLVHRDTGEILPETDFWACLAGNRTTMKMFRSDAEGRFVMTFDKPEDSSTINDVRVFDDQGDYVTNPLSWRTARDVITIDQDTLTLNAGEPLFISGTFMTSAGAPKTYSVKVYDTGTGTLLGQTTKPVDGHWEFTGDTGVAGETQEIVLWDANDTAKVTVNWVAKPLPVPATIEFASDAVTEVQVNEVQPASVNGTVKDSGGDPVPNATFTYVIDPDTVEPVNGTTDDLGEFEIEVDISTVGTKTLTVTTENNVEASHVINVTDIA